MSAISDKKETLYFESSLFCSMYALFWVFYFLYLLIEFVLMKEL